MFDFLRRFFAKEQPVEKIEADKFEAWFIEKAKVIEHTTKEKITHLKKQAEQKLADAKDNLIKLENATLRNPKITVREKQFMEGNRRAYIQRTHHFLEQIRDILGYDLTFLISNYKDYLENFSKSTQRSYRILQEFFSNEARDIAIRIREIDVIISQLEKDDDIHKFAKVEKIAKDFTSIKNKKAKQDELRINISEVTKEIKDIEAKNKNFVDQKESLEKSLEYKKILKNQMSKDELEKEIEEIKDRYYQDFSALQRPLKKYQRIAYQHDKIIEHYLTDPLNALVTDFNLKIVDLLQAMSKNLTEGKIVLKDKQSDKALENIRKLDREYFSHFLTKYNSAMNKLRDLEHRINSNPIHEELNGVQARIEALAQRKHHLTIKRNTLQDEFKSINLPHIQERIKNEVSKILKIKIELAL